MQYLIEIDVTWPEGSHRATRVIRAVSAKVALNKAVAVAVKLPCYKDREDAGIDVHAGATIRETTPITWRERRLYEMTGGRY